MILFFLSELASSVVTRPAFQYGMLAGLFIDVVALFAFYIVVKYVRYSWLFLNLFLSFSRLFFAPLLFQIAHPSTKPSQCHLFLLFFQMLSSSSASTKRPGKWQWDNVRIGRCRSWYTTRRNDKISDLAWFPDSNRQRDFGIAKPAMYCGHILTLYCIIMYNWLVSPGPPRR